MSSESLSSPGDHFADILGMETDLSSLDTGIARATTPVREQLLQPMGIVHGGVYASIAESLTSMATWEAVYPDGNVAMGMANQTSFLRPISSGTIHTVATVRHKGRTSWVWEVDMIDDENRLCAITRMTIAVRPLPGQG